MATTTRKTNATKATAESSVAKAEPAKPIIPKEIDLHQYIPVKNGTHGKLVYKNKRTGEKFVWDNFGDEQEIELQELKNAKASSKAFFENNWFMFDDDYKWVIDYLGLGQMYKNAISMDKFDEVFKKTPAEITKTISGLSNGQKTSIAIRAQQLIATGEIDSNKAISALEKALGIELIER